MLNKIKKFLAPKVMHQKGDLLEPLLIDDEEKDPANDLISLSDKKKPPQQSSKENFIKQAHLLDRVSDETLQHFTDDVKKLTKNNTIKLSAYKNLLGCDIIMDENWLGYLFAQLNTVNSKEKLTVDLKECKIHYMTFPGMVKNLNNGTWGSNIENILLPDFNQEGHDNLGPKTKAELKVLLPTIKQFQTDDTQQKISNYLGKPSNEMHPNEIKQLEVGSAQQSR